MDATAVTVDDVREVGPDTVALELEAPPEFDARPGQFVLVRARLDGPGDDAEEVARHYTISSPGVDETFELTVGVDPEGDLSPWLADREPGDEVEIEGPFGRITYEGDEDVVTVAGGPGIGPAVAIAEAAREAGHDASVIYRTTEPAHRDRLEDLREDGVPVTVLRSDRDEELRDAVAERQRDGRVYAFGFADFAHAVADAIEDAGGDPDGAMIENFG